MAGVEFKKCKPQNMQELSVHYDLDIRKQANHSNESIDKELTHLDYYLGQTSYRKMLEEIDRKIAYADENHPNKRKSSRRQECFILNVPCPPELEGTPQEEEFYQKVYEMYSSYMPGVVGACIHKDEKHEYYDSKKGELCVSRNHVDIMGVCITEDGRCHTSDFISPKMCQKVQDDIQALCLQEWGISYQTGEGRKGEHKSVEQLKQESQIALQKKLANEGLEVVQTLHNEKETIGPEVEKLREELEETQEAIEFNSVVLQNQEIQIKTNEAKLKDIQAQSENKTKIVDTLNNALSNLFTRFNRAYIALQNILDHWFNTEQATYKEICEQMEKPIEKGKTAMDVLMKKNEEVVFGRKNVTKEDVKVVEKAHSILEEATNELEEIQDEYTLE